MVATVQGQLQGPIRLVSDGLRPPLPKQIDASKCAGSLEASSMSVLIAIWNRMGGPLRGVMFIDVYWRVSERRGSGVDVDFEVGRGLWACFMAAEHCCHVFLWRSGAF